MPAYVVPVPVDADVVELQDVLRQELSDPTLGFALNGTALRVKSNRAYTSEALASIASRAAELRQDALSRARHAFAQPDPIRDTVTEVMLSLVNEARAAAHLPDVTPSAFHALVRARVARAGRPQP